MNKFAYRDRLKTFHAKMYSSQALGDVSESVSRLRFPMLPKMSANYLLAEQYLY